MPVVLFTDAGGRPVSLVECPSDLDIQEEWNHYKNLDFDVPYEQTVLAFIEYLRWSLGCNEVACKQESLR